MSWKRLSALPAMTRQNGTVLKCSASNSNVIIAQYRYTESSDMIWVFQGKYGLWEWMPDLHISEKAEFVGVLSVVESDIFVGVHSNRKGPLEHFYDLKIDQKS